jgi:hypothetical protein
MLQGFFCVLQQSILNCWSDYNNSLLSLVMLHSKAVNATRNHHQDSLSLRATV